MKYVDIHVLAAPPPGSRSQVSVHNVYLSIRWWRRGAAGRWPWCHQSSSDIRPVNTTVQSAVHSTQYTVQYTVQYGDRGGDSGGWRALGGDGGDRGVRDQDELPPRADGRHLHPALPPAGSLPRHVSPEHSPSHHIHILQ